MGPYAKKDLDTGEKCFDFVFLTECHLLRYIEIQWVLANKTAGGKFSDVIFSPSLIEL